MKTFVLLLVFKFVASNVEETDNNCASDENCLKRELCPLFQEKHNRFTSLTNRSSEYSNLKRELREAVCNKKEQAVCCQNENPCEAFSKCIARSECKYADDRIKEYEIFKRQNEKKKATEIIKELRDRVCDKKKKFICCPGQSSNSESMQPNHLPRLGSCGLSKTPAANVVGGTITRPGDFPFAALLGFVVQRKIGSLPGRGPVIRKEIQWGCGGTLINRWYVLTAAHCQGERPETKISKLRLGDWSVEGYGGEEDDGNLSDEQDFDITADDVKVHEGYQTVYENNHKNTVNDIALIKLPRPARLNDGVQMACLPFHLPEFKSYLNILDPVSGLVGRYSTVIGWGKTDKDQLAAFNGLGSRVMQKLQLPVLSKEQCNADKDFTPRESQICAGGELGKDSCRGDSGGPLFIQESEKDKNTPWYLIGIVSFGSKDCGNGRPGIYTRVSSFIPWIEKNLK